SLLSTLPSPPPTSEIAIFVSATESFSRANLNCSIRESLDRLALVVWRAKKEGIKVRGYVSVVVGCPFEGKVEEGMVGSVVRELKGMGCYEVSLGDTIGVGTPGSWMKLLEKLGKEGVEMRSLAAHCHDTYNTSIASILTCISHGITTVDSSIAGLGGCPYSPGSSGNVATEDVVYALESSGISTGLLPTSLNGDSDDLLREGTERNKSFLELCEVGEWISGEIGRENGSRAGKAALAKSRRSKK
ncbi:hydroxymethylglutaryl-CoA lyase, partial [Phenoliferia sp. Uapishka_3]